MFVWTLEVNFEQTSIIFVAKGHEKGIGVFFSTKYFAPGCFLEHIENSLDNTNRKLLLKTGKKS